MSRPVPQFPEENRGTRGIHTAPDWTEEEAPKTASRYRFPGQNEVFLSDNGAFQRQQPEESSRRPAAETAMRPQSGLSVRETAPASYRSRGREIPSESAWGRNGQKADVSQPRKPGWQRQPDTASADRRPADADRRQAFFSSCAFSHPQSPFPNSPVYKEDRRDSCGLSSFLCITGLKPCPRCQVRL